jgi:hypothetical protein
MVAGSGDSGEVGELRALSKKDILKKKKGRKKKRKQERSRCIGVRRHKLRVAVHHSCILQL